MRYDLAITGSGGAAFAAAITALDAQVLDQDTAVECGRLNFGTLFTSQA